MFFRCFLSLYSLSFIFRITFFTFLVFIFEDLKKGFFLVFFCLMLLSAIGDVRCPNGSPSFLDFLVCIPVVCGRASVQLLTRRLYNELRQVAHLGRSGNLWLGVLPSKASTFVISSFCSMYSHCDLVVRRMCM